METLNLIELKGLEKTTYALTKGMIEPYVRENYIEKFKGRLLNDMFGKFVSKISHDTIIMLTGEESNCLYIQTDLFLSKEELHNAIVAANSDSKISYLFSVFYSLGINVIAIYFKFAPEDANVYVLRSPAEINEYYENDVHLKFNFNIIK